MLKEVVQSTPSVAITYVHFPLSTHPFAMQAAVAAHCAEDRFGNFADLLFSKQDSIGLRSWERFRVDGGVADSARFHSCLASGDARRAVERGKETGKDFGIVATPTLIINGWRFEGVLSTGYLRSAIASLLNGKAPVAATSLLGASAGSTVDTVNGVPRVTFDKKAFEDVAQYTVAPVPLVIIDGASLPPEFDLTTATQVMALADGKLVVFSQIGGRILVFSPEGEPERRIGRAGRGPGELLRPGDIARAFGDTMVSLDVANNKVALFVASKGIVKEQPLPGKV